MLVNGQRALAYIVEIDDIKEITGADNIETAIVGGWNVIVKKQEFRKGDRAVFFEIDSKLPETDPRFAFLAPKHYKIKTMKLGKFGAYSQGLLMPIKDFPELNNPQVGTNVTEKLGVTYSVAEDNQRKRSIDPEAKYKRMCAKHPNVFKTRFVRWLMKRKWGKEILYNIFGRSNAEEGCFPEFVKKTDEERIENVAWHIGDGKTYTVTEKLDGTSSTYALRRKSKGKFEFFVCSRNVRLLNESQKTYFNHNIYWDMAFKYDIERHLTAYLNDNKELDWVYIQGESVGSVQGNPLKLKEDDLYVFNFVRSDCGRLPSREGAKIISGWEMKWVPILDDEKLQDNMEAVKEYADGKSAVNPAVLREGLVYRALDGGDSFKNVSRKYLLKKGE